MDRRLLALLGLVLLAALLLAGVPRASAAEPLRGTLGGPTALAPGAAGRFTLNATGGPSSEGGNYTIRYYLTCPDLTGALPVQSAPGSAENATGAFEFNVTAPASDQVVTLVVELNSSFAGRSERITLTRAITVITPIVLTATFSNASGTAAVNVPVRFYVDGAFAGETNISRIEPHATGTATLTWLPVGLGPGAHTVRVEADMNRNRVIESDKGEVAVLDVFYRKEPDLSWGWAGAIMAAMIVVTLFVVRRVRARRKK